MYSTVNSVATVTETASAVSPDLDGIRMQLRNAMNTVMQGGELIYQIKPNPNAMKAERMLGAHLLSDKAWNSKEGKEGIVPFHVPGTITPQLVGDLLLSFGWCEPMQVEGVSYLRQFTLTKQGIAALEGANAWWKQLSLFQKFLLVLTE